MFGYLCATVLGAALIVSPPAVPPDPTVFQGSIKDVRGTDGTLTLTLGKGKQARDRAFLITQARITTADGTEMKVGDLHPGDRVEVRLTADGRLVRLIRVLPALKGK